MNVSLATLEAWIDKNPLSDGRQTGERRRVRTPLVDNVGRSRVVTSLYPRLKIDGHLVSYDCHIVVVVIFKLVQVVMVGFLCWR